MIYHTPFVVTVMPIVGSCLCLLTSRGKSGEEKANDLTKTIASWYLNGLLVGIVIDVTNMFF